MKKKIKKIVACIVMAIMLTAPIVSSQAVHAAGGNVMDSHQREIVGMWVEVQGGRSGWATLISSGAKYEKSWSYDTQGKPYQLHVGVGGNPKNWGRNIKSGWLYSQSGSIQVNTTTHHWFGDRIFVTPSR